MRFASLLRSVCLFAALASAPRAFADEQPEAPRGHPAAVPLLTAAAVSGFLGAVALYIGLGHRDESEDLTEDPFRMGMVTTGGACFGVGLVLLTAGVPALLATPATGQQSSSLSVAPRALMLGYRVDF